MTPVFLGLSGPTVTPDERAMFRRHDPAGYILFARNCIDADQILALTDDLRQVAQRDIAILIDQEGGRVARMKPPAWPAFPAGARFGDLYGTAPDAAIQAARLNAMLIALMLRDVGVTVDCLPLLDVRSAYGHDIIGDRSFGDDPARVAALGAATLDGLRAGGIVGVVKHIPGHGRARVDSHLDLPVVDATLDELEADFAPFRALAGAPMGMTAHIVYSALDARHCATLSPVVIGETIRRDIGFDGLLMSDDLGMKALGGSFAARTADCLAAGCDIALHCSGDLAEMTEVAEAAGTMSPAATTRLGAAMLWATPPREMDVAALTAERDALLNG